MKYAWGIAELVHILVCFFILLLLPSCTHKSSLIKKHITVPRYRQKINYKKEFPKKLITHHPSVTVWIHGTKFLMRSSFHTCFHGLPALKHISEVSSTDKMCKNLLKLSHMVPDFFNYDSLYFFGWSGKLRVKERDQATEILYHALCDLSQKYYQNHGVRPSIKLVCHSHGGNIALTLARIHAQQKAQLSIDSLIVLACPVQLSTKDFASCKLFETVYAFYSSGDFVQIIAPELSYYMHNDDGQFIAKQHRWFPFSARRFDPQLKVRQARVKMNNYAVSHTRFASLSFLYVLPKLLKAIDDVYAAYDDSIVEQNKEVLLAVHKDALSCNASCV